jgi:hypothetical protein
MREGGKMKMGLLFSGLLWGSFFILLGLSVILKHTMNLEIPVIRVFLGLFLVYLGVQVLTGGCFRRNQRDCDVVFSDRKVPADAKSGEYNVLFGKGEVDLTGAGVKEASVKVNTIFGASILKVRKDAPVLVRATSAFGAVDLPDGSTAAFGNALFKGKGYQEGKPHLEVEAVAVFGHCQVVEE